MILAHLAAGWVNVTTVKVLAPVLTAENHVALLNEARHRRRSEVEILVARVAPRPDVRGRLRKLPVRKPLPMTTSPSPAAETDETTSQLDAEASGTGPAAEATPKDTDRSPDPDAPTTAPATSPDEPEPEPPAPAERPSAYRPPLKPLAPARFRLDVAVGQEAHDALRFLQDMLARQIPGGDIAKVVEHCLISTAAEVRRKILSEASAPRAPRPGKEGSRTISARVRRAVWKRDGRRCGFVGRHGRCTQTRYLELHHIHPHGLGGPATVENIAVRCRAHNVYESEEVYGVRAAGAPAPPVRNQRVSGQIAPSQDGGARAARAEGI